MSGMPLAGVQLVAQDYAPFMAAMQNATKAVEAFGAATTNSGKTAMPALADGAKSAASGLDGLNVQSLIGANVVGNLLTGAITTAWDKLTGFITAAASGTEALQDLTINLETLAAREILYSGATDNMSEALEMGASNAAGMFEELEKLSIASPFPYQSVVSVFQMGMQFGQTSEMAMKLTGAITDLAAVNKGIPGIMQRLSYNFSQMSMTGKIMGRDIRDLAMAGLDLNKVLKLQLGQTVKEVNADLSSGKIIFEDVAQALVDYTDKYIGPAAKRASRTLGGLKSTFMDVSFFAGKNLFLPAANALSEALGTMLDKALMVTNSKAFTNIGLALEYATKAMLGLNNVHQKVFAAGDKIWQEYGSAAEAAADGIYATEIEMNAAQQKSIDDMLSGWLEGAANALEWGVKTMVQFADGLIEGAGTAINDALDWINGLLEWWLAPGSPPRVAPDIDSWGASTINEWLKGFTEADFDLVDAISKPLKAALSLAADMGAIGEGDINAILSDIIKSAIAAASGVGGIEEVLAKIRATAGPFANEVADLAEKQFYLAEASKEVTYWQNELNAAQQRAFTAGKAVSKGVQEYNDLLRNGASKEVLKAKLAEINANREAQKIAVGEARTAEENARVAGEGIDTIKEQISLQSQLIEQMTELARLQILPAETGKGGGGEGGAAGAGGGGASGGSTVNEMLEKMRLQVEEKAAAIWKPIKDKWDESWGPIYTSVAEKLGTLWDNLVLIAGELWNFAGLVVTAIQTGDWLPVQTAVTTKLTEVWAAMKIAMLHSDNPVVSGLAQSILTGNWEFFRANLLSAINKTIGETKDQLVTFLTATGNPIAVALGAGIATADWKPFKDAVSEEVNTAVEAAGESAVEVLWSNLTNAETWGKTIGTGTETFLAVGADIAAGIINGLYDAVMNPENPTWLKATSDWLGAIKTALFANMVTFVAAFAGELTNKSAVEILKSWSAIWTNAVNLAKFFTYFIGPIGLFFDENFKAAAQGIVDTIVAKFNELIYSKDSPFDDIGQGIVKGIIAGITATATTLAEAAISAAKGAVDAVLEYLGIKSPSKLFMDIGANVSLGMGKGIEQAANEPAQSANQMAAGTVKAVRPPSTSRVQPPATRAGVSVQIGDVYISDAQEGQMFEARVERAVMKALGAV